MRVGFRAEIGGMALAVVMDHLESMDVQTVNLGGNEPICTHGPKPESSMLPRIIRELTDRGMVMGVTTNGTTARVLARHDPEAFRRVGEWHVSIDSVLPHEHDRNRGGAFFALTARRWTGSGRWARR